MSGSAASFTSGVITAPMCWPIIVEVVRPTTRSWQVGEADHAGEVHVRDREAHGIDDERELALAVGERGLGVLQALDVHQHHHHAHHRHRVVVQREVMRAHPAARAGTLDVAASENAGLAGERTLQVRAALVARGALEDLVGRAPQAFGAGFPRHFLVRVVHVPVSHVGIEDARGRLRTSSPGVSARTRASSPALSLSPFRPSSHCPSSRR